MTPLVLCLVLAQSAPQSAQPARSSDAAGLITGRVIDGVTKAPVSAAVVMLGPPGGTRRTALDSVITDGEGRYFFDNVPTGRAMSITVSKPGWLDGAVGRRRPEGDATLLTLKDDERSANVELQMWRRSVMSGAVLDEANEPVVDALVWAVRRRFVSGRARMELVTAVHTDDRGAFRLSGLVPGDYSIFLPATITSGPITFGAGNAPMEWYQTMTGIGVATMSVERDNGIAAGDGRNVVSGMTDLASAPAAGVLWMTLPATFYGSGSTPSFVHLDPGEERQGLAIAAVRVPTQSISGTLIVPGASAASHALHLLPAQLADYPLFDVATAIADANGAFTFYGVPAGNYVIRVIKVPAPKGPNARATTAYVDSNRKFVSISSGARPGEPLPPPDPEPLLYANENVSVGGEPIAGLTISLRPGVRISGRVEFEGAAPPPPPEGLMRMAVTAQAANGFVPYMTSQFGRYAADLTFSTPGLMPGAYVLNPSLTPPWSVKSVTAGGIDVTDLPIDATGDVTDVVITYTDRPGTISGTVTKQGGADADASVLIFPSQPAMWVDKGNSTRRVRSARPSADGAFSIPAPPPGEYLLIALPDEDLADWHDPATLARLAPRAQRLVVRGGESPTVNLTTGSIK